MRHLKRALWCRWLHNWRPARAGFARNFCDTCEDMPPTEEMLKSRQATDGR